MKALAQEKLRQSNLRLQVLFLSLLPMVLRLRVLQRVLGNGRDFLLQQELRMQMLVNRCLWEQGWG